MDANFSVINTCLIGMVIFYMYGIRKAERIGVLKIMTEYAKFLFLRKIKNTLKKL